MCNKMDSNKSKTNLISIQITIIKKNKKKKQKKNTY